MSWKDCLVNCIKEGKQKPVEEQEKEACELFMDILEQDKAQKNKFTNIPRFFFKKPINYNTLYFNVKQEAKTRFLSIKSMEIPEKKSKIFLINNF
jgi:hypothetical protein